MADELAVWLYGLPTAIIDQQRGRLRLTYTEEVLHKYPLGLPLLSLSLPVRPERYTHGVVGPFLDGLLPEGESRAVIASDFRVSRTDTYGLIRDIGRDCAGALVIQPADDPAPALPTTLTAEPLDDADMAELVANLRSAPLGVGGRVRISLAGAQEKLLLTRMPNSRWGRPVDGTPSTHILKPEIARFPHMVQNEAFCMRFARNVGVPVAHIDTVNISGRRLIVIERYDRTVHDDGSVERIHQEDFCQVTGTLPDNKYEEDGGPSLRRIAEILQAVAPSGSLESLLRATTINVLLANGDAHAKNFSLLHDPSGIVRLAPLYDLVSTLTYGDDRLAMYIDNVHRINRVTVNRIVNEASRWGMSPGAVSDIIADILDQVPDAVEAAWQETEDLQPDIPLTVDAQLARLQTRMTE